MKYTLSKVAPSVYLFETSSAYDLAMVFCRVQEFYENSNPAIRGKACSLFKFMDWYAKNYSPDGTFSYTTDFAGFNVPGHVIFNCYAINTDFSPYDKLMFELALTISQLQNNSNFYLIGARTGDRATIKHEMAHGFFHTDESYRHTMSEMVESLSCKKKLYTILHSKYMYDEDVLCDEAQAYLATGLIDDLLRFTLHRSPFVKVFTKYYKKRVCELVLQGDIDLM